MKTEGAREELLLRRISDCQVVSAGLAVGHGGGILGTNALLAEGSPYKHLFRAGSHTVSLVMDFYPRAALSAGIDDLGARLAARSAELLTGPTQRPIFVPVSGPYGEWTRELCVWVVA